MLLPGAFAFRCKCFFNTEVPEETSKGEWGRRIGEKSSNDVDIRSERGVGGYPRALFWAVEKVGWLRWPYALFTHLLSLSGAMGSR